MSSEVSAGNAPDVANAQMASSLIGLPLDGQKKTEKQGNQSSFHIGVLNQK
jgi:hypothetical protein